MDYELLELLKTRVTPRRRKLFEIVASTRTRHFAAVIEDVGHLHNTSAVLRSCEAFGIQEVHVVEEEFWQTDRPRDCHGRPKVDHPAPL